MSDPNLVNEILWTEYGWVATGDVEMPDPGYVAESEMTPEGCASTLDAAVRNAAQTNTPPPNIDVWGDGGEYLYTRHAMFSGSNHYRALDTAQILGLQPLDPTVPTIGPAYSVSEWWDHQNRLCNRLGERNGDEATFAARNARANKIPLEWLGRNVDVMAYKLLCRESDPGPEPIKNYYGLDAQQVLDNAWKPGTWLPTKPSK